MFVRRRKKDQDTSLLDFLSLPFQKIWIKNTLQNPHARKQLIQSKNEKKRRRSKTIRNQIIIDKILVKHIVNIDDDDNDNDENKSSFDRRCILFELASDVERRASNGLRVFS